MRMSNVNTGNSGKNLRRRLNKQPFLPRLCVIGVTMILLSSSNSGFCRSFARAWTSTATSRQSSRPFGAFSSSVSSSLLPIKHHPFDRFRGGGSSSSFQSSTISSPGCKTSSVTTPVTTTTTTTRSTRLHATSAEESTKEEQQSSSSSSSPSSSSLLDLQKALTDAKLPIQSFGGLSYMDTKSPITTSFSENNGNNNSNFFRVLFVLGGPGAGKGTQSELLQEHYPVTHLSVGELLRNVPADSPHRALIEQTLVEGKIVPVEISLALLRAAMEREQTRRGQQLVYLVDGFPRNQDNLDGWCRVMKDCTALWGVLLYQCPLDVLEERILQRGQAGSGRSDDNLDSLRRRFHTFEQDTMPIVEQLRQAAEQTAEWSVFDIHGDQSLEAVWRETQSIMNQLILHDVVSSNVALLEAVRDQNVQAYVDLCDEDWFQNEEEEKDAATVMAAQEGGDAQLASLESIQNAQFDVISGTHVALSYDRPFGANGQEMVREKRIWTHQGKHGWRHVHFARAPVVTA